MFFRSNLIPKWRGNHDTFVFPQTPLLIYLFSPLPEAGLRQMIRNLEHSHSQAPRAVWIVYHNPVLEHVLAESPMLVKRSGQPEHSVFEFRRIE